MAKTYDIDWELERTLQDAHVICGLILTGSEMPRENIVDLQARLSTAISDLTDDDPATPPARRQPGGASRQTPEGASMTTTPRPTAINLTDAEWMALIRSNDVTGPSALPACCANIAYLRDQILQIVRDGGELGFSNMGLTGAYNACADGHDLAQIEPLEKLMVQSDAIGPMTRAELRHGGPHGYIETARSHGEDAVLQRLIKLFEAAISGPVVTQ